MKFETIIATLAAIAVSLPVLPGQESAPVGVVRDGLREASASSVEETSPGPRFTDIDRLFEEPEARREATVVEDGGVPDVAGSIASSLGGEISLDASDLISVDYPNEEIRTVLRNVADLYMLNIVVPETLVGTTSIKLRDVTWRQIFSVVLDPVGYTFIEEGPIIKVVSRDALNIEPPITEIFMVNYADAESIAVTLRNLVNSELGGAVQVDTRSNALIVSERASKMDSIRQVVERLDKPTQQVMIESRFVEVTDEDGKNIGINWAGLEGYQATAGPFSHSAARDSNGSRGKSFSDGSDPSWNTNSNRSISDSKLSTAMFSAGNFDVILSALKKQGGTRLVSNPTVVTLNNQEAIISVGSQYPIPSYQYNEETGGFEVSGFEFKDIGIILKVTPSVNNNGLISLKVNPEVSEITGTSDFGTAQIPIISTRRTVTEISLKDGYTMGIGGLMRSKDTDDNTKVPGLGKLPGLGRLFRSESRTEERTNLLIFLTARILPSEEADFEDVFSQEMMQAAGVDAVSLKNR